MGCPSCLGKVSELVGRRGPLTRGVVVVAQPHLVAVGRVALLDVAHLSIRAIFIARALRLASVASNETEAQKSSEGGQRKGRTKGHKDSGRLIQLLKLPELLQPVIQCSATSTGAALAKPRQVVPEQRAGIALANRSFKAH